MGLKTDPVRVLEELLEKPNISVVQVTSRKKGRYLRATVTVSETALAESEWNHAGEYVGNDLADAVNAVSTEGRAENVHAEYSQLREEGNKFDCWISNSLGHNRFFDLDYQGNTVTILARPAPVGGKIGRYSTEQILRAYIQNLKKHIE